MSPGLSSPPYDPNLGMYQLQTTRDVLVLISVLVLAHSPTRDGIDVDAETQQLSSFCRHLGIL
jgi:hypothetical protein